MASNPDKQLSEQQFQAIELILKGETLTDVAKMLGVSRQTVSAWKNKDVAFKRELDEQTRQLKSTVYDKILTNAVPMIDRLMEIALKSESDKTALDAIIYSFNRILGTPGKTSQEVTGDNNNNVDEVDIDKILENIKYKVHK